MAVNWQKGTLFAVGIAVGVAAGVAGVMSLRSGHSAADTPRATSSMGAQPAAPAVAAPGPAPARVAAGECDQQPILGRKGSDDGQASLQAKPVAASATEIASLILSGKEAGAAGRQRDAEVSFLNACRNAELLQGDPLPLADAMYQLARHYANVAAFGAQPSKVLFERAERLYSASLQVYTARYGASHEKTRFAQEGLKTVQQVTGRSGPVPPLAKAAPARAPAPATPAVAAQAPPPVVAPPPPVVQAPAPAPAPSPTNASAPAVAPAAPQAPQKAEATRSRPVAATARPEAPAPAPTQERQAAAATPAPAEPAPQARRSQPSFDCARARSATERLICGDEDLARQDRELGQLHQRARQAAADPRAFQRESDAQWQQRENTCRDRECLQRWYAQRRAELAAAAATAPRPSRTERAATPERSERAATERPQRAAASERSERTGRAERAGAPERGERAAAPEAAQRSTAPAEPTARSSPPQREATNAAGAGAAPALPDEVPVTRAPVVRAPPLRARVAEPDEQPPAPPATASGSAGDAPSAEGSPNADQ